jgi:hypothetical protein
MPRGRKFADIPTLPNVDSPYRTPTTLMIDARYSELMLIDRWTWDRFARLCQYLEMTAYEMASIVMMPHHSVEKWKESNILTCQSARHIALLLTLIEFNVCRELGDAVDPFEGMIK